MDAIRFPTTAHLQALQEFMAVCAAFSTEEMREAIRVVRELTTKRQLQYHGFPNGVETDPNSHLHQPEGARRADVTRLGPFA